MATTTALSLDEKLLKQTGDWIQELVTTALAANKSVISTHLAKYTGRDDYFNDWWLYIEDFANKGQVRQISDYDATVGAETLTVRGANWTPESDMATFRVSHTSWDDRLVAINDAIREIYPYLFRHLEDRTMVTGNILPDNSFEQWVASDNPSFYSATHATLTRTTTAGLIRGVPGTTSMKVTDDGSGGGYAYLSSRQFPRLRDLMGRTVTLKCWAYPEDTAGDASIEIYTKQADGSTQTLPSTTANPLGEFTLLELEDQKLNDDLVEVQIRFKVATTSASVYFDSARLVSQELKEYLLLSDFASGMVYQVYIQTSGFADDICDDLQPQSWETVYGHDTYNDGTYEWLVLPHFYSNNRQIRVIGTAPLSTLSTATDTIEIDGEAVNLLIAYAKYLLYQKQEGIPASEDISRYERASAKAYAEYMRLLPRLKMVTPSITMNIKGV